MSGYSIGASVAPPPGYPQADLSHAFNTALTPLEESQFQAWRASLPTNLQSVSDYDLRGAWKADAKAATNGHLPDTWKKPNHPTFSNESIYSDKAGSGGAWTDGTPSAADDRKSWVYWASPANLKYRSGSALSDYFTQREPDSTVVLPISYSLPRFGR